MNVDELWGLTQWVQKEVVGRSLQNSYHQLATVVRRNTQANHQRVPIEQQKNELLNSLRKVDVAALTQDQLAFLQLQGIAGYLGKAGAENVEEILIAGGMDIATAAEKLEAITAQVNGSIQKLDQIRQGLEGLVSSAPPPINEGEVMLRVTFTGAASISNVVDLKKWGDDWHKIARGIAMAHGEAPEAIRVVGAGKGSIILELATTLILVKTASAIIMEALKVSERVVTLLQQVETLKSMHLSNKKIAQDLKDEAEKERKEGTEQINKKIAAQLGIKATGDGEKSKALELSIKTLVAFLTKGGEVDCVMPADPANGDDKDNALRAELAQTFVQIRKMEDSLRLLEHKSPESEGEEEDEDGAKE